MKLEDLLSDHKPWILVDKVIEYERKKRIVTMKHISASDYFLIGHFPSYSIYPGILLLQGLKQSGEILIYKSNLPRLSKEDINAQKIKTCEARFLLPLQPGDTIEYRVELLKSSGKDLEFHGEGLKDKKIAVRAKWKVLGEKDE